MHACTVIGRLASLNMNLLRLWWAQVANLVVNGAKVVPYSKTNVVYYFPGQSAAVSIPVTGTGLAVNPLADTAVWGSSNDKVDTRNLISLVESPL